MGRRSTRTQRQVAGTSAEDLAVTALRAAGWTILARNVRLGRDEIDILAIEPGLSPTLVVVEVRSARTARFGAPEESVDGRKVGRTYRAALALVAGRVLPDGQPLPRLPWRVDLVAVDARGRQAPSPRVRHLRRLGPP
jgi:putative endonuclease